MRPIKSPSLLLIKMNAAETNASRAIADWMSLTLVSRSLATAVIDTFMIDVSTTRTNIAIPNNTDNRRLFFAAPAPAVIGSVVTISERSPGQGDGASPHAVPGRFVERPSAVEQLPMLLAGRLVARSADRLTPRGARRAHPVARYEVSMVETERRHRRPVVASDSGAQARTRRWLSRLWAALRVLAGAAIVFVLYFFLPFTNVRHASAWFVLALLMAVCVGLMAWQIRAIIEAVNPQLRAIEALAVSVSLLLVSFSTVHYLIGQSNPAAYTAPLSRLDALYFSVTVFSTVGFGDISPVTEVTRAIVTIQMLVDLLVLGVGVRIILGAVEAGRTRAATASAQHLALEQATPDE